MGIVFPRKVSAAQVLEENCFLWDWEQPQPSGDQQIFVVEEICSCEKSVRVRADEITEVAEQVVVSFNRPLICVDNIIILGPPP